MISDILVNPKNRDYYIVEATFKHTGSSDSYFECVSLKNIRTGKKTIESLDTIKKYDFIELNTGNCNYCEHATNGCTFATIEGKCPVEQGFSFKYVNNKDEKKVLEEITKLLTTCSDKRFDELYGNLITEIKKLIKNNRKYNRTLKNMIVDKLQTPNTDVDEILKEFYEKIVD